MQQVFLVVKGSSLIFQMHSSKDRNKSLGRQDDSATWEGKPAWIDTAAGSVNKLSHNANS